MDFGPLPKRNVQVFGSQGVGVVAGFWQYGTVQWDDFYRNMDSFVVCATEWTIFQYDSKQHQRGAQCPPSPEIVQPGHYIMLSLTGDPVRVGLVLTLPRPRVLTPSDTPACESHYRTRARIRDGKCLITGLQTRSRLKVAHIFSRDHDAEWVRKGYPSKIIDTADEALIGGLTKIDSMQNVITIRTDLRDAWNNYEFGVDPNNNYRITAFVNGNEDINGLHLQLDHIQDPELRPLDELFIDHFTQGLYEHMKGTGEKEWTDEDYDEAFGNGSFDMSNPMIWDTVQGKQIFEITLADRLFDQSIGSTSIGS